MSANEKAKKLIGSSVDELVNILNNLDFFDMKTREFKKLFEDNKEAMIKSLEDSRKQVFDNIDSGKYDEALKKEEPLLDMKNEFWQLTLKKMREAKMT